MIFWFTGMHLKAVRLPVDETKNGLVVQFLAV